MFSFVMVELISDFGEPIEYAFCSKHLRYKWNVHRLWENCINPWLSSILIQIENQREAKYIRRTHAHIKSPSTNGNSSVFFYLHSYSLCFIPSRRVRIVFFIWTDLLFALCAPHSEKTINRERKTKSGENVYFHTEKSTNVFYWCTYEY